MKNNNVEAQHLGGGVVLFKNALEWDWDKITDLAEEVCVREHSSMYTESVDPETGKFAYLNRSGFYFRPESIDQMPRRGSRIHQDDRPEVIEFLTFLEEARDAYLMKYIEMFPIAFKTIWWKIKGHIVSYKPGGYLGPHSDASSDWVYGVHEPKDQLATRSTIANLIYFNSSVDTEEELDGKNFTAGHHYFNYFDITVKPERGDLIMFPANYMGAHEVKPVGAGIRYSYLGWYAHGTPNPAVSESATDPLLEPDLAKIATNVYMPYLKRDFVAYLKSKGKTSVDIPGFTYEDFGDGR